MLERDDELFARRIREGIASREEMALAADLLQKRTTQRQPKKGQPNWIMNEAIVLMVLHLEANADARKTPHKTIVPEVAKIFGVSIRHVYNVLAEYGLAKQDARRPHVKDIREAGEQAFQEWLNAKAARK